MKWLQVQGDDQGTRLGVLRKDRVLFLQEEHDGVLTTLDLLEAQEDRDLDPAGWFTAAPYYDCWIATLEFHVRLHHVSQGRDLIARGRLVRRGKR